MHHMLCSEDLQLVHAPRNDHGCLDFVEANGTISIVITSEFRNESFCKRTRLGGIPIFYKAFDQVRKL